MLEKGSHEQPTDSKTVKLDEEVVSQLREYILMISHLYKSNSFHNFEHASHVIMSTVKLLDRIRSQDEATLDTTLTVAEESNRWLYLDPLTKFGVVFAALIHDVDHSGLSNMTLIEERWPLANLYKSKSIAEQNSIDVAWKLLMDAKFKDLRQCIFESNDDFGRFRQVVINSVLATDIFDNDLKSFRESRWNQVFAPLQDSDIPSKPDSVKSVDEANRCRKNAIIIEHLIQASDVVHTMQHWKVYQKWNKRLFMELYAAYQQGHSKKSPVDGWYDGELWFFDHYIIPLAKKLRICGVFGVSCDEFLDYAIDNRFEWEKKGSVIVNEWEIEANVLWNQIANESAELSL
jgi:3'5'-cyclic nucleotide phosphodiesterase